MTDRHAVGAADTSDSDHDRFDVYLPLVETTAGEPAATHVAHMFGDRDGCLEALAGFVARRSELPEPLRTRIDSVDEVRLALEALGPARVGSIEPL